MPRHTGTHTAPSLLHLDIHREARHDATHKAVIRPCLLTDSTAWSLRLRNEARAFRNTDLSAHCSKQQP